MVCTIPKINVFGLLIEMKQMKKVASKFPQKVMVWLGVCSKGVTPLVIFDRETVDHVVYTQKVLPVALKYGYKTFGKHWTFEEDGANPHIHHLTQKWCQDNFPSFIDKDHWPPNSPDLNPLDYCILGEFAQCVDWKKVTSKATLIDELKRAVKKIRQDVVLQSCSSWTARLSRLLKNDGRYFEKINICHLVELEKTYLLKKTLTSN